MSSVKVFSLPNCPHCVLLKRTLDEMGVPFSELDMEDPENQTELLMNSVFVTEAPVLFISGKYYTFSDIFDKKDAVSDKIINELNLLKKSDQNE